MRFIKLVFVIILIQGCSSGSDGKLKGFEAFVTKKDAIILSCLQCRCIIENLNEIAVQHPEVLRNYDIYADSTCVSALKAGQPILYVRQSQLDSISTDIYNMLILKRSNGNVSTKLVRTPEADNMLVFLK